MAIDLTNIKMHPTCSKYGATPDGQIYSFKKKTPHLMSQTFHRKGYLQFSVSDKNASYLTQLSHRFVWECFNGKIPTGLQINHIDTDKTNNHIDNLELVNQIENMKHGKENGVLYGAASPNHPFYKGY